MNPGALRSVSLGGVPLPHFSFCIAGEDVFNDAHEHVHERARVRACMAALPPSWRPPMVLWPCVDRNMGHHPQGPAAWAAPQPIAPGEDNPSDMSASALTDTRAHGRNTPHRWAERRRGATRGPPLKTHLQQRQLHWARYGRSPNNDPTSPRHGAAKPRAICSIRMCLPKTPEPVLSRTCYGPILCFCPALGLAQNARKLDPEIHEKEARLMPCLGTGCCTSLFHHVPATR